MAEKPHHDLDIIQAQLSEFADQVQKATATDAVMINCIHKETDTRTRSYKGLAANKAKYADSEEVLSAFVADFFHFFKHITGDNVQLIARYPNGNEHEITNNDEGITRILNGDFNG